ncbi:hypothetical protein ABE237_29245 [Brevibacillus formosus]|uniref:hypothetical protein n=1 Tax=Brevibacillus formosus TaxID=54913 RepID=UPI0018CEEF14|nr:hypothetical protein [Brevibacillus formosus]MBG9942319.1 hypothetical protein [Brevibacillus formosus]
MANDLGKWKILLNDDLNINSEPYFKVSDYNFYLCDNDITESELYDAKAYSFSVKLNNPISNIEFFMSLQSVDALSVLADEPYQITDLIVAYENSIREGQKTLFHDIRKQYMVPVKVDFISKVETNKIALLGYSIFDNEVDFFIKAFDYSAIRAIFSAIVDFFSNFDLLQEIQFNEHIKWIRQKQLKVYQKEKINFSKSKKLLQGTIRNNSVYSGLLREISKQGYIDRTYKDSLKTALSHRDNEKLLSLLEKSLLLPVENSKVALLHNSVPLSIKEDDLKTVYTLEARLWQYFINDWFEEYIGEVLQKVKEDDSFDIELLSCEANSEYNFKGTPLDEDKVELDWLVLLKRGNDYKLIALECKRTMSNRVKKKIREKYEEKVTKTINYDLIDAYINVGFFSEKNLLEHEKIVIKPDYSVPFLTIASTDFNETVDLLKQCFESIMK